MKLKTVKKKATKAARGVGMAVLVPTVCVVGGIAIGAILGVGLIVMTAQELTEE